MKTHKILILSLCAVLLGGKNIHAGTGDHGSGTNTLGGSCRTAYPLHGVYDATLLFGIDELRDGDVFLDMDAGRNTFEYRAAAYGFFEDHYGIEFDPGDPGQQFIGDGDGGMAFVWPLKLGDGPTHQVYAIDAQEIPVLRNRIPVTNLALWNDGFFVFAVTDFRVHGSYGGDAGAIVRAGDLLAYGQYRMINDAGNLFDVLTFEGDTPTLLMPFTRDPATSSGSQAVYINASTHSPLFGQGRLRATGEISPLADGTTRINFSYVLRAPEQFTDSSVANPVCRNVPPVPPTVSLK